MISVAKDYIPNDQEDAAEGDSDHVEDRTDEGGSDHDKDRNDEGGCDQDEDQNDESFNYMTLMQSSRPKTGSSV